MGAAECNLIIMKSERVGRGKPGGMDDSGSVWSAGILKETVNR